MTRETFVEIGESGSLCRLVWTGPLYQSSLGYNLRVLRRVRLSCQRAKAEIYMAIDEDFYHN